MQKFFNIVPYILLAWTVELAWLTVFKNPQFGGRPGLLYGLFGVEPQVWFSYGLFPIVISLCIHYVPYTFALLSGVLTTIDAQLEEERGDLRSATYKNPNENHVSFGFTSLRFSIHPNRGPGAWDVWCPSFLGLPACYYTPLHSGLRGLQQSQQAEGYVLAILLIFFTALTVLANPKLLGTRKRFTTITGQGGKHRLVKIGRWKIETLLLMLSFVVLFVFVPLALVLLETLLKVEGRYTWGSLTLHCWIGLGVRELAEGQPGVLRNPLILGAIKNSVFLALMTALVSGALGGLIG